MEIKWELSFGNIASMMVTLVTVGTLIWYLSNALTELRGTDQMYNLRIERLEAGMKDARLDREMVIDMRADLRVLRQYMDEVRRYVATQTVPRPVAPLP